MIRQANSILRFAERIGFASARKNARLRKVARHAGSLPRRWRDKNSERIVRVAPAGYATVYDIEVPKHHRFIANGIISHNTAKSQLLRYIASLAPRAIYTSGKSSSAAGLTAAAIKDDLAPGQWTLEAGALVLADKGLAAVDELDKMNPQDRDAMHEAMEQQTISVAKAGITATLQSRCAILGAANPKFGRFDTQALIIEQIDLPPALMSRFDVIFSLSDKPNRERDGDMADHILRSHHRGERDAHRKFLVEQGAAPDSEEEGFDEFTPIVPTEFVRKYIAYAKQRVFPILTEEAIKRIREVYVDIRKQGEGEAAAVPMTARQLEAFVRLAEASARVRLSPSVAVEDAERAIRIVQYYLRKIAGEGGRLDIDIIAAGTSRAQREAARTLLEIIRELDGGAGVTEDDIIAKATSEGIEERRARDMLTRLSEQGQIYAPDRRHYKVASR
jgi:replicative DNA helicase Mcm